MFEQFEKINEILDSLEKKLEEQKAKNDELYGEIEELKSIIDDRDLEILQLQEDAERMKEAAVSEKTEIDGKLESLLGRINRIAAE